MELNQLFGPVAILGLNVYFVALGIRVVCQMIWPSLKKNVDWEDLALPAIPVFLGMAFALIPKYPLPDMFTTNIWVKMAFGAPVGASSGLLYRIFKAIVKKIWGVDADKDDTVVTVTQTQKETTTTATAVIPAPDKPKEDAPPKSGPRVA